MSENEAGEGAALSAERWEEITEIAALADVPEQLAISDCQDEIVRLRAALTASERERDLLARGLAAANGGSDGLKAERDAAVAGRDAALDDKWKLAKALTDRNTDLFGMKQERDAARAQLAAQQAETARLADRSQVLETALSWLLFWVDKYALPRRAAEASAAADKARSLLSPQRHGYPDPRRKRIHWRHMTLVEAEAVDQEITALLSGGAEEASDGA